MSRRPLILLAFHWYLESLHEGASRHFLENGYDTAVLNSDSAASFAGKPVAGLLGMQPQDPNHPVRRFSDAFAGPVVELSLAFPEKRDWGRSPEDCEAIGRLASERLRRLPARSLLFVDGGHWWNHDARWDAFRRAPASDRRACERFHAPGLDAEAAALLAEKLLRLPKPVAVFGSVDEWARLALDAAELAKLKVPGDVFLLGFGNRELVSRVAPVPISTIGIDYAAWSRDAARLLHAMIRGAAAPGTVRAFAPGAIIERESTGGESGGDPLCLSALALMRGSVAAPPDVPALAKRLGVSKATLERAFATHLGVSVARRFLEIRIEAAKALLASGEKIEWVTAAVGFDSPRGFTQAFTRVAGETPGAYAARGASPGQGRENASIR